MNTSGSRNHTPETWAINRLYARCALRRMRMHVIKRERRLKAQAPLLLCYSRAHHSIVDLFGLGILSEVSTGNTLLQCGFEVTVDLQKGSTNEITYQDRDGHDRSKR